MAGVLIYQGPSKQYYSFVIFDDSLYYDAVKELPKDGHKIIWKKGNINLEQIENSRKTKDDLVAKLNKGEKVDLKKELNCFFP